MMKLYKEENVQDIADTIRSNNHTTDTYKISEMSKAISNACYDIKEKIPYGEVEDTSIHIEDSLKENYKELEMWSNEEQVQYNGKNKFNYKDVTDTPNDTVTNDDGWITMSYDNSDGTSTVYRRYFTNNLNLKTNTTYNIFVEIKDVSGTGTFYAVSSHSTVLPGQFSEKWYSLFSNLSSNSVINATMTTMSSFDNSKSGLRTFMACTAGQSFSITFRLSVLEDTTITPETFVYEPYCGGTASPNPDYPQNIPMLTNGDEVKFESTGRSFATSNLEVGTIRSVDGATTNANTRIRTTDYIELNSNNEYTVDVIGNYSDIKIFEYDSDKNYLSTYDWAKTPYTFKTSESTKHFKMVLKNNDLKMTLDDVLSYQIYESYTETSLNITIPENEFVGRINDDVKDKISIRYNKDDGKYHAYLDKVLGKASFKIKEFASNGITDNSYSVLTPVIENAKPNYTGVGSTLMTHLNVSSQTGATPTKKLRASIPFSLLGLSAGATVENARKKMIELYGELTNTCCYPLETPYTILLGPIDMPLTQNPITNAYIIADLEMKINAKYYKDFTITEASVVDESDLTEEEIE